MSGQLRPRLTPEEYLARERDADFKSEYFNGEIVAFAGTSRRHNLIVFNTARELGIQLKAKPCEAYVAEMRVRAGRSYVYPDLVVVCGQPVFADDIFDVLNNPTLVIEVLSESTEFYDRNIKSNYYRTVDSLVEYLFISQSEYHVEQYTRQPDGRWLVTDLRSLDDVVELTSIGCKLSLREVYERILVSHE